MTIPKAPPKVPKVRGPLFCGAKLVDGSGNTCRNPAGKRTSHLGWGTCWKHGGAMATHIEAAAIAKATATARLFGAPREVDPISGMLEMYWQSMGMVDAIEAMCMQLLPAEVVWGLIKEKRVVDDSSSGESRADGDAESLAPVEQEFGPGLNIWVKLLADWHDRAFSEAERMLKLDLSSRQAQYTHAQVVALVGVLLSPELGLDEDQRRTAARMLRQMETQAIDSSESS